MENIIRGDAYRNIDFLTGVVLNEGLYFAEYHIGYLYNGLSNQPVVCFKQRLKTQMRLTPHNSTAIITPDIIQTQSKAKENHDDQVVVENIEHHRITQAKQTLIDDPNAVIKQFSKLDYVERYINANFQYGECYIDEIKKRYEYPGNE